MDPAILTTKVVVDNDPDYEGYFSLWTDTDGINAELAGKIGEREVADRLAALWNKAIG